MAGGRVPSERTLTLAARALPSAALQATAERAWERVDEALETGAMTITDGKVITLDADQYLALVKWAAQYRQPASTAAPLSGTLVQPRGM